MQFLINKGFTPETITKIKNKYNQSILDILRYNQNNVINNIDYFEKIGLNNIEGLMLYRIDLFIKDNSEVVELFNEFGTLRILKLLNDDVSNIDLLEKV